MSIRTAEFAYDHCVGDGAICIHLSDKGWLAIGCRDDKEMKEVKNEKTASFLALLMTISGVTDVYIERAGNDAAEGCIIMVCCVDSDRTIASEIGRYLRTYIIKALGYVLFKPAPFWLVNSSVHPPS